MNQKIEAALAEANDIYRELLEKVLTRQASPAKAVKAKCLECVGYSRQEIVDCSAEGCPLFRYRPFVQHAPKKTLSPEERERLREQLARGRLSSKLKRARK